MKGLCSSNQKTVERLISQKAIQMGNSYSCQMCAVGFMFGVCLTTLFMAFSPTFHPNSTLKGEDLNYERPRVVKRMVLSNTSINLLVYEKATSLYSIWSASLSSPSIKGENTSLKHTGHKRSNVPKAPHLEICKLSALVNQRLDKRIGNEKFPRWTIWKGSLNNYPVQAKDQDQAISLGAYPPWITGSDEENYPLTRKVQRDIWAHQHRVNCSDSSVRFLVADWERGPELGIGAQIAAMSGLLAIAVNEKRVLVTNYYNRADHHGCQGASRSSWSCYFFSETSQQCRDRAFNLMQDKQAWEKGMITGKDNNKAKQIWAAKIPRVWGSPWRYLQPTTEVNGTLISHHRKMDRRWWRAQAVRYLMRFKTEYMCNLLNVARHEAFGREAATMVVSTPEMKSLEGESGIEEFVWSDRKPWLPRPLLSVHVRMGDKAREMKIVQFKEYMRMADRIRQRFPHLNTIWLSTEMQEVIDKTRMYPHWKFYYSKNVTRQVGNMEMASYEASLGRETSSNYALVNFLMAVEADFFVGALGSTWCFLIDGMRNTGGKVMAGYLSVNKDRFW